MPELNRAKTKSKFHRVTLTPSFKLKTAVLAESEMFIA
jgi:hypothetical protein